MPSGQEFLQRMMDALALSDPEWDIAVGSPEFKILESVSTELASVAFNSTLNDFHFDIDVKSGADLDNFVQLFGTTRQLGKRATGTVTFSRGTPADVDYSVPYGSQVVSPATLRS